MPLAKKFTEIAQVERVEEESHMVGDLSAVLHRGRCHCGRVRYEVQGEIDRVEECNCSICTKKAYLHWIVARERFRLLTPWQELATYSFNTGVAQHHFCKTCGHRAVLHSALRPG